MREYVDSICIKFKSGTRDIIKRRMAEAGITNMSAYIRKMALNGYVIRLDSSDMKEIVKLLQINSNTLNQYAKKANATGCIYLQDIQDIHEDQQELLQMLKNILHKLNMILANPGSC